MWLLSKSFKLRVALGSCIVSGLLLLLLSALVVVVVRDEFERIVNHDSEAMAAAIVDGVLHGGYERDPFQGILTFEEGSYRGPRYSAELKEGERNVCLLAVKREVDGYVYRNPVYWKDEYEAILRRSPSHALGSMEPLGGRSDEAGLKVGASDRWEARYYKKDGVEVFLALNQLENKDEYLDVAVMLVTAVPVALLLIAIGGWCMGLFAVRPVESMSRFVSSIGADDLGCRLPESSREDEMGDLARLINAMLERIERGYEQAKRFTADASHELRTPLAILQAELEAKMRESDGDLEWSGRMLEEIRRLKSLTQSLLFLSKADSGTLKIGSERVNVSSLLKQTVEDMRDLAEDQTLVFEISDELGEAICVGDASLLQQALMNLLRNATKFNRSGGKIVSRLVASGAYLKITIGNNGRGIDARFQSKIFERFYRGYEERNRETGGFGLGLNITREIAKAHGGDIRLIDSSEDWTEFALSLPKG